MRRRICSIPSFSLASSSFRSILRLLLCLSLSSLFFRYVYPGFFPIHTGEHAIPAETHRAAGIAHG